MMLDRQRGCLIGLAIGDALAAALVGQDVSERSQRGELYGHGFTTNC